MKSQSHRPLMALVSVVLGTLSVGALIALAQCASDHFDPVIVYAHQPRGAVASASTVPISITESGFEPATETITAGTTVMWTNLLSETVHLVSGEPYCVYLPLVVRDAGQDRAAAGTLPSSAGAARQSGWADVDIDPGLSYTHIFTTAGGYPYYLSTDPRITGWITVTDDTTPPVVQMTELNYPDYVVPHFGGEGTVPSAYTFQFNDASYDPESGVVTTTFEVDGYDTLMGTQGSHFTFPVTFFGTLPFTYTATNGAGLASVSTGTLTGTNDAPDFQYLEKINGSMYYSIAPQHLRCPREL
jgi:plastocyanin